MVVFGGGHNDYAGNEIMVFDIESLRWMRINDPSPRLDPDGAIERSGYYPDANGNPDLQQPRSRHSYWSALYVPTIDRYCAISAFATFPHRAWPQHVDCFDFNTKLWSQKADAPNAADFSQPRSIHRRIVCGYWAIARVETAILPSGIRRRHVDPSFNDSIRSKRQKRATPRYEATPIGLPGWWCGPDVRSEHGLGCLRRS